MIDRLKVLATPVLILLYWQMLAASGLISSYLLPSPATVGRAAIELWHNGILTQHITTSLLRVFSGFTISFVLAFFCCPVGSLLANNRTTFVSTINPVEDDSASGNDSAADSLARDW